MPNVFLRASRRPNLTQLPNFTAQNRGTEKSCPILGDPGVLNNALLGSPKYLCGNQPGLLWVIRPVPESCKTQNIDSTNDGQNSSHSFRSGKETVIWLLSIHQIW